MIYELMLWEYHDAQLKFAVYEGPRLIVISDSITSLDIQADLYKGLKKWYGLYDNSKYLFPIRTVGGDDTVEGEKAGDIYFMQNGYRVVYDPAAVQVTGVLFSDNYDTPWLYSETRQPIYPAKVSSLVNTVETVVTVSDNQVVLDAILTSDEVANAVWNAAKSVYNAADTMGHLVNYADHFNKSVYCDPGLGNVGDGSQESPFNSITLAIDEAELHNTRDIVIYSDIQVDRNIRNINFIGVGVPEVDTSGFNVTGSEFQRVRFKGLYVGSVIVQQSVLLNGAYLNGFFENCALAGTLTCIDGTTNYIKNCASSMPNGFSPIIDMGAATSANVNLTDYSGRITIVNCNSATDDVIINLVSGEVILDASCTNGTITITGAGRLTDNSAGSTVNNYMNASGGGNSPGEIASAVWDAEGNNYNTRGTFGGILSPPSGLSRKV